MNTFELGKVRLASQQIGESKYGNAKDVLDWMGAMQAQDFAMAKWAVGIRFPNSTEQEINSAIDSGDILRTHLLRPTWHFVTNNDIYWMLGLTAPKIKNVFKSRNNQLGLTKAILRKSISTIEKSLSGGTQLTRKELIQELGKAKIPTDENRASHIFAWAELEGLLCSGRVEKGKPTYAILGERVQKKKAFTKDEALATLARKYFSSRSPATFQDFVWWSGLTVSEGKYALGLVSQEFIAEKIDNQIYWLMTNVSIPKVQERAAYLLPAFDEFIISYRDRTSLLPNEIHKKAVSDNGIFRPVILVHGQVKGIWKRTIIKEKVSIVIELFEHPNKETRNLIEEAAADYGRFLGKNIEMNYIS